MSSDKKKQIFIDTARIFLKAGDGGDGCMSFRREKFIPYGGPNGGNGGNGGDIYLQSDPNLTTLIEFSYHPHIAGKHGTNGQGSNKHGANGESVIINVPMGTLIKKDGRILADLALPYQKVLVAKGGLGGRGNTAFKTRFNTAPKISEKGQRGEQTTLELVLKVLADVGIVGFPNAGKSTFLSRISSARPKIADYPFTTLSPNLGVVRHKKNSFVAADIPGLIEGAHKGKGLGDDFLKHVERTKVLVHLVDPMGFNKIDAVKSIEAINHELFKFNPGLLRKHKIIVVNKSDISQSKEIYEKAKKKYKKFKVLIMSAATGDGISKVLDEIIHALSLAVPEVKQEYNAQVIAEHKIEPGFSVKTSPDGVLEVEGKEIKKLLEMTNFNQPQAVIRLRNIFKKIGIDKALVRRGISEGDIVRVCGRQFQWQNQPLDTIDKRVSRRRQ